MEILSEVMLTTDYITRVVGFFNIYRIYTVNGYTIRGYVNHRLHNTSGRFLKYMFGRT